MSPITATSAPLLSFSASSPADCGAELVVCGGGGEGGEEVDMRLHAIVHRLDCTSNVGWCRIMGYATAEECMRTYAQLCVAFGPGARVKLSAWAAANNGRRLPPQKHAKNWVRRARRALQFCRSPIHRAADS